MIANLKKRYTLEEYLELDRGSEARLEFHGGEIFDMSGASDEHDAIEVNMIACLAPLLASKGCRLLSANMRIKVPSAPPYRYGDMSALCGEAQFEKIGGVDAVVNPALIVEVLSPSTEKYDFDVKFRQYQSIESFNEYLLIRQDRIFVTHFVRRQSGEWLHHIYDEATHTINLESVECQILVSEIYRNVSLVEHENPDPETR